MNSLLVPVPFKGYQTVPRHAERHFLESRVNQPQIVAKPFVQFSGIFNRQTTLDKAMTQKIKGLRNGETLFIEGATSPGITIRRLGETLLQCAGHPQTDGQWMWLKPKTELKTGQTAIKVPYPKFYLRPYLGLPKVTDEAIRQSLKFNTDGVLEDRIVDGFRSSSGSIGLDAIWNKRAQPVIPFLGNEIILIDRKNDPILAELCLWARSLQTLPQAQRVEKITEKIYQLFPNKGNETEKQITAFPKKAMYMGEVIAREAGICRHYSILFKVLADEANVPTVLQRGIIKGGRENPNLSGCHMWNEIECSDGSMASPLIHDLSLGFTYLEMTNPTAKVYFAYGSRVPLYPKPVEEWIS